MSLPGTIHPSPEPLNPFAEACPSYCWVKAGRVLLGLPVSPRATRGTSSNLQLPMQHVCGRKLERSKKIHTAKSQLGFEPEHHRAALIPGTISLNVLHMMNSAGMIEIWCDRHKNGGRNLSLRENWSINTWPMYDLLKKRRTLDSLQHRSRICCWFWEKLTIIERKA